MAYTLKIIMEKKKTLNPTNRAQGCVRLCQFRAQHSNSLLPSGQNVSYTFKNKTRQLAVLEQPLASSMEFEILLDFVTNSDSLICNNDGRGGPEVRKWNPRERGRWKGVFWAELRAE